MQFYLFIYFAVSHHESILHHLQTNKQASWPEGRRHPLAHGDHLKALTLAFDPWQLRTSLLGPLGAIHSVHGGLAISFSGKFPGELLMARSRHRQAPIILSMPRGPLVPDPSLALPVCDQVPNCHLLYCFQFELMPTVGPEHPTVPGYSTGRTGHSASLFSRAVFTPSPFLHLL